jgi:hypothetical protein
MHFMIRLAALLAALAWLGAGCGGERPPAKEALPVAQTKPWPATLPGAVPLLAAPGGGDTLGWALAGDSLRVLAERWPPGAREGWCEIETGAGRGWTPESSLRRPAGERGTIATH